MSHLYIAHSASDTDSLLELHEALRSEGVPVWYDAKASGEAADRETIESKIESAFAVLVLISQNGVRSKAVRHDVEHARVRGIPVIGYRIDKARLGGYFKSALVRAEVFHSSEEDGLLRLIEATKSAYKRRCPVVAIMNLKGGIGKTTVSGQVFGAYQAERANRVLLVDLDPQYNLSQTFFDMEKADESAAIDRSVISLFELSRIHSAMAPSPAEDWNRLSSEPFSPAPRTELAHRLLPEAVLPGRFDLISGQFEISKYAFATDAAALGAIKTNFLRVLDHYRSEYDLIVFDTNPNATFLTRCALAAADRIIAPMHPDVYSLRGVRLLNQVMHTQVAEAERPKLSVLFNGVSRSEQSTFEADVRTGVLNSKAGFALSDVVLERAVPRSGHLVVKTPEPGAQAWEQLVVHRGRGGGLRQVRDTLKNVALEIDQVLAA